MLGAKSGEYGRGGVEGFQSSRNFLSLPLNRTRVGALSCVGSCCRAEVQVCSTHIFK